ncbi:MAG: acyl-CoA dehydrogenase [Chloroflexota bacterium]|nr:MAG: acyl-CoA dehydrogenase [Chloroflexota bacterium]
MDFGLSDEQKALQKRARTLARTEFAPMASHWDETETFPMENVVRLGEEGLVSPLTPAEYGGGDLGFMGFAIILSEVAAACAVTGDIVNVHATIGQLPLVQYGTDEQKQKYLVPATTGKSLISFALTEPEVGSDPAAITTVARRDGDSYVIDGVKQFATLSGVADTILVAAKTETDGKSGVSLLIVDKGTPGLVVGERSRLMGQRGLDSGLLHLESCVVPRNNLVGKEGQGLKVCLRALNASRIGTTALSVGIAQRALEESKLYAKQRVIYGKPIADLQAIQFMVANAATDIEATWLLMYRAAKLADAGHPAIKEASMAKLFATEMVRRHTLAAIDVHGGYGFTRNRVVERLHRDCIILGIGGGTADVQRTIMARQIFSEDTEG